MDRKLLKAVRELFERREGVVLAYVFGSAARGDTRAASDLDFAVLLEDPAVSAYKALWSDLHDLLAPVPFDLVTLNGAGPVISFDVIREGRPLYYRSDEELNSFERRAWHRYQDTRHLRKIGDLYLEARAEAWSSKRKRSASASPEPPRAKFER